jgi:GDPmannose 4,6-dehydratase
MAQRRALICGVSGQDGAYLARFLLERDYEVWGTSRDAQRTSFARLAALGIRDRVRVLTMAVDDLESVSSALRQARPAEIYNLAGQTSVGASFQQPDETFASIASGTLNLLEGIRPLGQGCRYYNAASGECFGDTGAAPADEATPFRPQSPYAAAKAEAFAHVAAFRETSGNFACSGILFNHESPLRSERFVTQKIVAAACRIAAGSGEKLALGNLDVARDWGWAPEYVATMWMMLQQPGPRDYVIATGQTSPLRAFAEQAFRAVGLDWEQHIVRDEALVRPADIRVSRANPAGAAAALGWSATMRMADVATAMVSAERARTAHSN